MVNYELSVWKDFLKTLYYEISIGGSSPNYTFTDSAGRILDRDSLQAFILVSGTYYPCAIVSISSPSSISITYFDGSSNKTITVDKIYSSTSFFDERRIVTIGSSISSSPFSPYDIKLRVKIDGTSQLTFSLLQKGEGEDGEKVDNPFVSLLSNETKIKLRYNDKWYSLNIDSVDEDSASGVFSYIANEIYIEELSKSGFNIVLDSELENNSGTIVELGRKVLENTDWGVDEEESDILTETSEEPLYQVTLISSVTGQNLNPDAPTSTKTFNSGSSILIYYSSVAEREARMQVVSSPSMKIDDRMVLIDENSYYNYDFPVTYDESSCYNEYGQKLFDLDGLSISSSYRGKKTIVSNLTTYEKNYGGYVEIFNRTNDIGGEKYYRYKEYEYITSDVARNLITNSKEFTTNSGWGGAEGIFTEAQVYPQYTGTSSVELINWLNAQKFQLLSVKNTASSSRLLYNTGIRDMASSMGGIVTGETYLLRIKARNASFQYITSGLGLSAQVQKYSSLSMSSPIGAAAVSFNSFAFNPSTNMWTATAVASATMTREDLLTSLLYISVPQLTSIYLEEVQLFKQVFDSNNNLITPDSIPSAEAKIKYTYYSLLPGETGGKAINKVYSGYSPSTDYVPVANPYHEKIRNITIKESNRFNIIQTLCETFECWPKFSIAYEPSGRIQRDELGVPKKTVAFKRFAGKDNYAGFKYGINLSSTKRTIVSSQLVTQLIVKDNSNQFAENGFCSIARAANNPSKENSIYNFNYFLTTGKLDYGQVMSDLYGTGGNGLQYLYNMGKLNKQYDQASSDYVAQSTLKIQLEAKRQTYQQIVSSGNSERIKYDNLLYAATNGYRYVDLIGGSYNSLLEQPFVKDYLMSIQTIDSQIASASSMLSSISVALASVDEAIELFLELQESIRQEKEALTREFNVKYASFLKEGTWISEEYLDDDRYYLDALGVSHTSAFPQVSYGFQVVSVSELEDFENYIFDVGDKTYVEDTEFFGYVERGGYKTPYKEEVIISEIVYNLSDPSTDTITIQNFKTQFEDLFKRITAAVQSVQFNSGRYNRAAEVVAEDGTINVSVLKKSLEKNMLELAYADLQSITVDEKGITATSPLSPNKITRIINGGIYVSDDGGLTWTTGISADGINTALLTAGQLDTSQISILSGGSPAFRWDHLGLNAFKSSGDSYSIDTFVRHDQYGIYGIKGYGSNYSPSGATDEDKIKDIQDKSVFALTWDGFSLRGDGNNGFMKISSENDIEIFRTKDDGTYFLDVLAVKIGKIRYFETTPVYGIEIYDDTGQVVMSQTDNGYLGLTGMVYVGPSFDHSRIRMGNVQTYVEDGVITTAVIQAMNVNGEVTFELRDSGDAIFKGHIEARSGKIGGFDLNKTIVNGVVHYNLSSPYVVISNDSIKILNGSGVTTALLSSTQNFLSGVLDIAGDSSVSGALRVGSITVDSQYGGGMGAIFSNNQGSNFLIKGDGGIVADNIDLSGRIQLRKYIKMGSAFMFNPSFDSSEAAQDGINKSAGLYLAAGAYSGSTYAFEVYDTGYVLAKNLRAEGGTLGTMVVSGLLTVGTNGVVIDGLSGSIHSNIYDTMRGWVISKDGSATFNDVTVRGSIKTAIFEYNTVQAVGGTILVRPSARIISYSSLGSNSFAFVVDNIVGFYTGDMCCAQTGSDFNSVVYGTVSAIAGDVVEVQFFAPISPELVPTLAGAPLISFGQDGDIGISINSSNSNAFSTNKAITVFERKDGGFNAKIILGLMPTGLGLGEIEGTYGLYAENVFLKGRMISAGKVNGINYSSGLNTESLLSIPGESDTSPIVFWAGAIDDDISNAPLKITRNGTLHAEKGVFKGSVVSSLIKSSIIVGETARTSLNSDKENGLSIMGNGGISFYGGVIQGAGEITIEDCRTHIDNNDPSLVISAESFYGRSDEFSFILRDSLSTYLSIDTSSKTLFVQRAQIDGYLFGTNENGALRIREVEGIGEVILEDNILSTGSFAAESSFKYGLDNNVYEDVIKDGDGATIGYDLYIVE